MAIPDSKCPNCSNVLSADAFCLHCALTGGVEDPPDPAVQSFAGYELLEEIGQDGAMGSVFKARDAAGRIVAIKMLRADRLRSEELVRRFQIEVEAAANLDHEHVLPIYDIGEHHGQLYYTMRLATGGSLARQLAEGRWAVPRDDRKAARERQREIARLMQSVAEGIQHAHERGVLHRDLKPGNLLLDQDGTVYVSDFGLAKQLNSDSELTHTHGMVGTPAYMAPEQTWAGGKNVTARTDVWALGAILYELLTARVPFKGEGPLETLEALRAREPVPPQTLNPLLNRDLAIICMKCLEKDPSRRYTSAADLAIDLGCFLGSQPINARPASLPRVLIGVARRHPVKTGALIVAFTTLLSGFGLILHERNMLMKMALLVKGYGQLRLADSSRLLDNGQTSDGLRLLAMECREYPDDRKSLRRLYDAVARRRFLVPYAVLGPHVDHADNLVWSSDSKWIAVYAQTEGSKNALVTLLDVDHSRCIGTREFPTGTMIFCFTPDSHQLLLVNQQEFRLIKIDRFLNGDSDEVGTNTPRFVVFNDNGTKLLVSDGSSQISRWALNPLRSQSALEMQQAVLAFDCRDGCQKGLVVLADGTLRSLDTSTGSISSPKATGFANANLLNLNADGSRALVSIQPTEQILPRQVLIDTENGRELNSVVGAGAAFSPDGKWAAIDIDSERTEIINASTGRSIPGAWTNAWVEPEHAFAPDSKSIYVRSDHSKSLAKIAIPSGEPLCEPVLHRYFLHAVSPSPDGRFVAITANSTNTVLWHANPTVPKTIGVNFGVNFGEGPAIGFSPDGKCFASSTSNRVWIRKVGEWTDVRPPFELDSKPFRLRFNGNGNMIAAAADREIAVAQSKEPGQTMHFRHESSVRAFDLSPDGHRLVAACTDRILSVWDTQSGQRIVGPLSVAAGSVPNWSNTNSQLMDVRFDPDAKLFAVALYDGEVQLFETKTGRMISALTNNAVPGRVEFGPDGKHLAVATLGNAAMLWNLRDSPPSKIILQHSTALSSIEFSRDGRRLVTACLDGVGRVWDVASGAMVSQTENLMGQMFQAQFDTTGGIFATAGPKQGGRIWDSETGLALSEILLPESDCIHLDISSDGRFLAMQGPTTATEVVEIGDGRIFPGEWMCDLAEALAGGKPVGQPLTGDNSPAWELLRAMAKIPKASGILNLEPFPPIKP